MRKANALYVNLTLLVALLVILAGGNTALAANSIVLDCPATLEPPATGTTYVEIPVRFTNDVTLGGFTIGFQHSSDFIEIDSFHTVGSNVPMTAFFNMLAYPDSTPAMILVGWTDFTFVNPVLPTTDGLMFTLVARVPAGAPGECIDIDSVRVPPAGDFIFAPQAGGQITPDYFDCGTCEIEITGAALPPVAVCQDVTTDADGNCQADVSIDNGSYDPQGQNLTYEQDPPGPYTVGVTLVKLTVTNESSLWDTCSANVTVVDATPPVVGCPGNITVGNDPGECGAIVSFTATAGDNCGIASLTYSTAPGSFFDIGTTQIEVIATDDAGLADTCYFDVTVNDTEPPVANCPADISVGNDAGECGAIVGFSVSATDNCPGESVVATPASGTFFAVGTTPVEVIATDAAGIKDTCYFNVTVNDTENPVANCPADINVGNDPDECGAVVNFTVSASDNCPGQNVVASPTSGTFFAVGTTPVEVIATDAAGNKDTCYFSVTVNDSEDPVVTCPGDTAIQLDLGETEVVVEYVVTASDNCPGVSLDVNPPSGSTFLVNTTTPVNATATDASGNTANCSFNVTVIPPNYPPEARDTAITTDEDVAVAGQLYAEDPESDDLTFGVVDGPFNGTLTAFDANTGAFTYLGNQDFNGADSFTFVAEDLTNTSNEATVRITVSPVNDAPVARDTSITGAEDAPISGFVHGYDIDGDELSFAVDTDPNHGALTAFNAETGAFTYEPDGDYFGPDTFTFLASDSPIKASSIDTVFITITPVNDAPVAADTALEVDEDNTLTADVTADDVEGDALQYEIVGAPAHGTAGFADPNDPTFTYDPDPDYNGGDNFTFRAYDGDLYSGSGTVSITVNPVNDNPVARDTAIIIVQNQAGQGRCQGYDVDGDPLYFTITGQPNLGTVSDFDPLTGIFTYTPDLDTLGEDTLFFSVDESKVPDEGFVAIRIVEPAFFNFDPDTILFAANEYEPNPDPITQEITSASPTGDDFDWQVIINSDWLEITDSSGSTPTSIDYIVDIEGLLPGTYEAEVIFEVLLFGAGLGAGPRDTVVVILELENPLSYDTVVVSQEIGEPGAQVMVPIYVNNSAPTEELDVPIGYDPAILEYNYTDYAETRLQSAVTSSPHNTLDHVVQLRAYFTGGTSLPRGSGTIAKMYFTIKGTATEGQVAMLVLPPLYDLEFILDADHGSEVIEPEFAEGSITVQIGQATDDYAYTLPEQYALDQNYPNPFNPETIIEYALPEAARVRLTVFNLLGQEVKTLVDEYQSAGRKWIVWDGTDARGIYAGSGIYFYRMTTENFDMTRKMVLMK